MTPRRSSDGQSSPASPSQRSGARTLRGENAMRSYAFSANAFVRLITIVATALSVAVVIVAWPAPRASADTGTGQITLAVTGARDVKAGATFLHRAGEVVSHYKWLINVD